MESSPEPLQTFYPGVGEGVKPLWQGRGDSPSPSLFRRGRGNNDLFAGTPILRSFLGVLTLSAKIGEREDESKRALRAFRRAYPNWEISPNQTRCPICAKKYPHRRFGLNFCESHHWANEKWLKGAAMISMKALRDPRLQDELKAEGLWSSTD